MTSPRVSVVIPVLDPGEDLASCLGSIPVSEEHEVIVVDNASKDGSVAAARRGRTDIKVITNAANVGFAKACNQGAAIARGDYLLFLNSDAKLEADGLVALLDWADGAGVSIVQPVVIDCDGKVEDAGGHFTFTGFTTRRREPMRPEPYRVFTCTGACLLIRREAFRKLGEFHERYFAYIEDTDLCWRANLAGVDVFVHPAVRATHRRNRTTKSLLAPSAVRYLTFRNRWRTVLSNAGPWTLMRVVPALAAASVVTSVLLLLRGEHRSAVAVVLALAWPVAHIGELRRQRRAAQALRVRSDREVFSDGIATRFGVRLARRYLKESLENWR